MTALSTRVAASPLAECLLAWSADTLRDLPWRTTRDAWWILVSETMLQQTQVARVRGPFVAFVGRWPDAPSLAAARPAEVIDAWRGLGYNRRAVRLRACAQAIVDRHHGLVPDDVAALLDLPGVGDYTARAVLAFAFERPVGVVDTNTARVLARAVAGHRLARREAQILADELVPAGRSWAWNSAVLDLGAMVCTARHPACDRCPLARSGTCAWVVAGRREPDPAVGTAGASGPQSRFGGSDRQGRGRLVAELLRGPIGPRRWAVAAGWPGEQARAERVAGTLVGDGLAAVDDDGRLCLP
ncbi:MAG: A/G-specific adenine glycosylase [Actinomycetota bacterium]|nr:A/G-specific adenine glycosylase [Actinomycetota bacterium]